MDKNKNIPNHIAFILDGNRRWAKEKGLPTLIGHTKGMHSIDRMLRYASEIGVKIVTVYAFSTENWNRSKGEVDYLMKLFSSWITKNLAEIKDTGIKIRHLGKTDKLPSNILKNLENATKETKNNSKLIFNLALNYGGRDEIVRAIKKINDAGKINDISEELISKNLDTEGLLDPDLIVRTSGEQRLSGFLLWQCSYSELYFPKVYWPDFDEKEFDKAVEEFNNRKRRYGKG